MKQTYIVQLKPANKGMDRKGHTLATNEERNCLTSVTFNHQLFGFKKHKIKSN